jgi:3-oxoacyl-[acyl-carrier protein] reductase
MTTAISFSGKVALVTGSARGIGKGIAQVLMELGAAVYVNDLDPANCEASCADLNRKGNPGTCYPIAADVSKREQVEVMVDRIIKEKGQIDFLVNNAGITSRKGLFDITDEHWDAVLNVNLRGTFLCTQTVARHMVKRRFGRIVNVSSLAAFMPAIERAAYAAAKAGIIAVTKVWAGELAPYGITVNVYAPGDIETEMIADTRAALGDEYMTRNIALKRFGTPEEVGRLVAFLVSPWAEYLTGILVPITGGKFLVQNPADAWKKANL